MAELVCAVCLYDESGDPAAPALTVIEGYAVCEGHIGFVAQGMTFHSIITTARNERRQKAEWDAAHPGDATGGGSDG